MRPLRLEMQAFGPYAGCQELSFADLKGRRFFLIHGPTGSGKTTILDAMAFALYGDTSGAERDAADMRSDQAVAGLLTEVTFDFAIGSVRYRAWRRPAQERPKLRGDGVTTELQDAVLWRLEPTDGDGPTRVRTAGKPLASGWTKVTAKAAAILGFRAEQFRQVVMLPQGRFQELLRADSAGRADILATLFATQHYARLERELKEAAGAARKALERVAHERSIRLEQADLESEEALRSARDGADEEFAAACEDRARLEEIRTETEAAERAAAAVATRIADAQKARERLEELLTQEPEIAQLRDAERRARAAATVHPVAQRAQDADEARAAAEDAHSDAAAIFDRAAAAHEQARQTLAKEEARAEERSSAARRVADLEALRRRIGPLQEARESLQRAVAEQECVDVELRCAQEIRDGAAAAHAAAAAEKHHAQQAIAEADGQATVAAAAAAVAEDRSQLALLVDQLAAVAQRSQLAAEQRDRAEQDWRRARELATEIERQWTAGQAALLARSLEPGTPCPVCGSTNHPAPAAAAPGSPDSADLEAARVAAAAMLAARDDACGDHAETEMSRTTLLAKIEALCNRLGDQADRSPKDCVAEARAAADSAAACVAASQRLPELERRLNAAADDMAAAEEALATARRNAEAAQVRRAAAAATLEERAAALPQDLQPAGALDDAITAAAAAAATLTAAQAAAVTAEHETAIELSRAKAELAAAARTLKRALNAFSAAAATLDDALVANGFADPQGAPDPVGWRAAVRTDDEIDKLVTAIKAYDGDLAAARGRAEQAAAAAAGQEQPDLPALRDRARQASETAAAAADRATELRLRLEELDALAAELTRLRSQDESLTARYAVVGHIARLANGDNQAGLTLQRFVLGALLDAVLVSATAKLRSMSKGRYQLLRTDERRGSRRAAGLDMDVYDAWTGKSRPVSTLSGGESFLAALSLALGLAETVQACTGGIYLDTIFVDEGFGTLDDEALDLAIDTLMQLQEGDRLVGIISHVAELKERVDARLEVTAERGVSRARFVVP